MKAVIYRRPGSPDVLEYAEVPQPVIRDRQVLVKVHAAGVNPVDWKMRRMRLRVPWQRWPMIPGSDLAGEVVHAGAAATRFRSGDAVYGLLSPFTGGAYAQYAAIREDRVARKPTNLSFEEAASVPVAGLAALQALRDLGHIAAGHRVLINGASGGVGMFAVQIAKAYGATVTAVASGKNGAFAKELGADRVVDYRTEDFTRSGGPYDLIFDAVASRSFAECRPVLDRHGVYVSTLPSVATVLDPVLGAVRRGPRARAVVLRVKPGDLDALTALIEAGKVRPRIERIFPLAQAAEAHALSEAGRVRGKLVLRMDD
ncbi:MAG: NAD(P)-dependent alcohol dehydrogenase [Nitrospirota bacterium]